MVGTDDDVATDSVTLLRANVVVVVWGAESRLTISVVAWVTTGLTAATNGDSNEVKLVPLLLPLVLLLPLPVLPLLPLLLLPLLDGLTDVVTDCVLAWEPDETSNPATSIPNWVMNDTVAPPVRAVENDSIPSAVIVPLPSIGPATAAETGARVMVAARATRRKVVLNAAPLISPPC